MEIFFFDDCDRSLTLAETRKIGLTSVFSSNVLPLLVETLRWKFNVQIYDAGLFLFFCDFHVGREEKQDGAVWTTSKA